MSIVPDLADPTLPTTGEQNAWATAVGWGASHAAPNDRDHWLATITYAAGLGGSNGTVEVKRLPPSTTTVTVAPPTRRRRRPHPRRTGSGRSRCSSGSSTAS